MKKIDLSKTQFLVDDSGIVRSLRAYRRKRALMLFDKQDQPIRLITWDAWVEFRSTYPKDVEDEKLTVKNVWTLVPVTI
jgi:hypothetical protein